MGKVARTSIRGRLVLLFSSVVLPLLCLLVYITTYTFNLLSGQIVADKSAIVQLWENQICTSLDEAGKYINYMALNDLDFEIIMQDNQDDYHLLAKRKVYREFEKKIQDFEFVDAMFIVDSAENPSIVMRGQQGAAQENIQAGLVEIVRSMDGGWHAVEAGGDVIFTQIYEFLNIKVGFASSGESIRSRIESTSDHFSGELRVSDIGPASVEEDQWIIVSEAEDYPLQLSLRIDERETLQFLPQFRGIILVISGIILSCIPLFLYLLRKSILTPLNDVNHAIVRLEKGDLDYRIPPRKVSTEFQRVYQAFNAMTEQIKNLRIRHYEEQLAKQKARLRILQLQVNPHFLINCLNIVYSLAQLRDYETIQRLVRHMSNFFRNRLRKGDTEFVTLQEEFTQVKDYLSITEICVAQVLEVDICMEERLARAPIPPLAILTLVENIIKHAACSERTEILIRADLEEGRVTVTVRDDGAGIPPERLKEIRNGEKLADEQGEHFGLQNTRDRIERMPRGSFSIESAYGAGTTVTLSYDLSGL